VDDFHAPNSMLGQRHLYINLFASLRVFQMNMSVKLASHDIVAHLPRKLRKWTLSIDAKELTSKKCHPHPNMIFDLSESESPLEIGIYDSYLYFGKLKLRTSKKPCIPKFPFYTNLRQMEKLNYLNWGHKVETFSIHKGMLLRHGKPFPDCYSIKYYGNQCDETTNMEVKQYGPNVRCQ
jgi:hypothetical protein